MARILFTWEMGEGLGHLMPMRPVLESLVKRGHQLLIAATDLRSAQAALGHIATTMVQSPMIADRRYPLGRPAEGAADLLAMNGFLDQDSLHGRHHAWCQLAALLKPDLIIADHSPGALLMARALSIPAIHTGTGFSLPPERRPVLFPGFDPAINVVREDALLPRFNALIEKTGGTPLCMLADLYNRVEKKFLLTFEEIDHLGPRTGLRYLGANVPSDGEEPVWPVAGKQKVFAYLKPFPAIEQFLQSVKDMDLSLLMFPDRVDPAILNRHQNDNIRFVSQRQSMRSLMQQSDLLAFNGNHGTAAAALLAGIPMLGFPLHQEHEGCCRRFVASGLGAALFRNQPKNIQPTLEALIDNPQQKQASMAVAQRYQGFDYQDSVAYMVAATEELL
ncbi:MAG: hypothetical protein V2I38_07230 [Alcanivoracaceae bacterium]|jgi:hypothetical protein|nr:hypothetical protein [Alcanivoracaceae bacterium]